MDLGRVAQGVAPCPAHVHPSLLLSPILMYDHRTKCSYNQNVLIHTQHLIHVLLCSNCQCHLSTSVLRGQFHNRLSVVLHILSPFSFSFAPSSEVADDGHGLVGLFEVLDLLFRKFDIDRICARRCQILWEVGKVTRAYR